MSGSVAEERIRALTEVAMRRRWPSARIVHELQLQQGGVRIDLAAVMPDRLYLAEIKSERDTLKRLGAQLARAVQVADEVWLCLAPKHEARIEEMARFANPSAEDRRIAADLYRTQVRVEAGDDFRHLGWIGRDATFPDPRAQFDLLWSTEMAVALGGAGVPSTRRSRMTRLAVELYPGAAIRRMVCGALLRRPFPRADAPIAASGELLGLDAA